MGNFNFGHDANNPLSTGNGYANMLLGVFTTYTELTSRVDRDVRHWQNDFYFQDNWRMTPNLTVDLGLRVQHSGSDFEVNNMNSGFFTDLWQRGDAARVYRLACTTGVPGNQACAAANQRAIDPANPSVFFPTAFTGNIVPGSGQQLNGIITGGMDGTEGRDLFHVPVLRLGAACGHGVERDRRRQDGAASVLGDLLQLPAIDGRRRLSVLRRLPGLLHPPDPLGAVRRHHRGDAVQPDREPGQRHGRRATNSRSRSRTTSTWRSSATSASTPSRRSPGSATTPWNHGRFVDDNRLPLYVYGDPTNLVNNAPIDGQLAALSGLRQVPGHGLGQPSTCPRSTPRRCSTTRCRCRSQRRLTNGLQMGFAYTLAKGEGYTGYDPYTDQIGGEAAIQSPLLGTDHRRSPAQHLRDLEL